MGVTSEQKMREALEKLRAVVLQRNCGGMEWGDQFDDLMTALGMAAEALAQQPAAVVELTDEEIISDYGLTNNCPCDECRVGIARRIIAAHEARRGVK